MGRKEERKMKFRLRKNFARKKDKDLRNGFFLLY